MKTLEKKYGVTIEQNRTSLDRKSYDVTTKKGKVYTLNIHPYYSDKKSIVWEAEGWNFMNRSDCNRFPKSIGYLAQDLCKVFTN